MKDILVAIAVTLIHARKTTSIFSFLQCIWTLYYFSLLLRRWRNILYFCVGITNISKWWYSRITTIEIVIVVVVTSWVEFILIAITVVTLQISHVNIINCWNLIRSNYSFKRLLRLNFARKKWIRSLFEFTSLPIKSREIHWCISTWKM